MPQRKNDISSLGSKGNEDKDSFLKPLINEKSHSRKSGRDSHNNNTHIERSHDSYDENSKNVENDEENETQYYRTLATRANIKLSSLVDSLQTPFDKAQSEVQWYRGLKDSYSKYKKMSEQEEQSYYAKIEQQIQNKKKSEKELQIEKERELKLQQFVRALTEKRIIPEMDSFTHVEEVKEEVDGKDELQTRDFDNHASNSAGSDVEIIELDSESDSEIIKKADDENDVEKQISEILDVSEEDNEINFQHSDDEIINLDYNDVSDTGIAEDIYDEDDYEDQPSEIFESDAEDVLDDDNYRDLDSSSKNDIKHAKRDSRMDDYNFNDEHECFEEEIEEIEEEANETSDSIEVIGANDVEQNISFRDSVKSSEEEEEEEKEEEERTQKEKEDESDAEEDEEESDLGLLEKLAQLAGDIVNMENELVEDIVNDVSGSAKEEEDKEKEYAGPFEVDMFSENKYENNSQSLELSSTGIPPASDKTIIISVKDDDNDTNEDSVKIIQRDFEADPLLENLTTINDEEDVELIMENQTGSNVNQSLPVEVSASPAQYNILEGPELPKMSQSIGKSDLRPITREKTPIQFKVLTPPRPPTPEPPKINSVLLDALGSALRIHDLHSKGIEGESDEEKQIVEHIAASVEKTQDPVSAVENTLSYPQDTKFNNEEFYTKNVEQEPLSESSVFGAENDQELDEEEYINSLNKNNLNFKDVQVEEVDGAIANQSFYLDSTAASKSPSLPINEDNGIDDTEVIVVRDDSIDGSTSDNLKRTCEIENIDHLLQSPLVEAPIIAVTSQHENGKQNNETTNSEQSKDTELKTATVQETNDYDNNKMLLSTEEENESKMGQQALELDEHANKHDQKEEDRKEVTLTIQPHQEIPIIITKEDKVNPAESNDELVSVIGNKSSPEQVQTQVFDDKTNKKRKSVSFVDESFFSEQLDADLTSNSLKRKYDEVSSQQNMKDDHNGSESNLFKRVKQIFSFSPWRSSSTVNADEEPILEAELVEIEDDDHCDDSGPDDESIGEDEEQNIPENVAKMIIESGGVDDDVSIIEANVNDIFNEGNAKESDSSEEEELPENIARMIMDAGGVDDDIEAISVKMFDNANENELDEDETDIPSEIAKEIIATGGVDDDAEVIEAIVKDDIVREDQNVYSEEDIPSEIAEEIIATGGVDDDIDIIEATVSNNFEEEDYESFDEDDLPKEIVAEIIATGGVDDDVEKVDLEITESANEEIESTNSKNHDEKIFLLSDQENMVTDDDIPSDVQRDIIKMGGIDDDIDEIDAVMNDDVENAQEMEKMSEEDLPEEIREQIIAYGGLDDEVEEINVNITDEHESPNSLSERLTDLDIPQDVEDLIVEAGGIDDDVNEISLDVEDKIDYEDNSENDSDIDVSEIPFEILSEFEKELKRKTHFSKEVLPKNGWINKIIDPLLQFTSGTMFDVTEDSSESDTSFDEKKGEEELEAHDAVQVVDGEQIKKINLDEYSKINTLTPTQDEGESECKRDSVASESANVVFDAVTGIIEDEESGIESTNVIAENKNYEQQVGSYVNSYGENKDVELDAALTLDEKKTIVPPETKEQRGVEEEGGKEPSYPSKRHYDGSVIKRLFAFFSGNTATEVDDSTTTSYTGNVTNESAGDEELSVIFNQLTQAEEVNRSVEINVDGPSLIEIEDKIEEKEIEIKDEVGYEDLEPPTKKRKFQFDSLPYPFSKHQGSKVSHTQKQYEESDFVETMKFKEEKDISKGDQKEHIKVKLLENCDSVCDEENETIAIKVHNKPIPEIAIDLIESKDGNEADSEDNAQMTEIPLLRQKSRSRSRSRESTKQEKIVGDHMALPVAVRTRSRSPAREERMQRVSSSNSGEPEKLVNITNRVLSYGSGDDLLAEELQTAEFPRAYPSLVHEADKFIEGNAVKVESEVEGEIVAKDDVLTLKEEAADTDNEAPPPLLVVKKVRKARSKKEPKVEAPSSKPTSRKSRRATAVEMSLDEIFSKNSPKKQKKVLVKRETEDVAFSDRLRSARASKTTPLVRTDSLYSPKKSKSNPKASSSTVEQPKKKRSSKTRKSKRSKTS